MPPPLPQNQLNMRQRFGAMRNVPPFLREIWGTSKPLTIAAIGLPAPVRRLQQKTQVFPLDVKASVRSRLTHSLEVQETGRQISRRVLAALPAGVVCEGAFINLVEMSCLLHDVGNPPFGHFGEQVMSQWLAQELDGLFARAHDQLPSPQWATLRQDLLVFDGNAQSLRLVHSLHELNLTLGQLAALCKYPQQPQPGVSYGQHHGWSSKRGINKLALCAPMRRWRPAHLRRPIMSTYWCKRYC